MQGTWSHNGNVNRWVPETLSPGLSVPVAHEGTRPRGTASRRPRDPFIHVRALNTANWWSVRGVLLKRREIERRGLPSFKHWRFITLTLTRYDQEKSPDGFRDPLTAYHAGKDRMRRFLNAARLEGLWKPSAKWCWKLEFHKDGWPHWHLLVGRTAKFSVKEMTRLSELWAIGRVSVEMVRNDDFLYSFKYAFKPVLVEDEGQELVNEFCLPDWFLDYEGLKLVDVKCEQTGETWQARKPVTFTKARFWQTSKDFYTGKMRPRVVTPKAQITWGVPFPVRLASEASDYRVQIVARDRLGHYVKSSAAILTVPMSRFMTISARYTLDGVGAFLGINSAVVPESLLIRHTNNTTHHLLCQTLQKNSLTLKRALYHQQLNHNLLTC